MLIINMPINRYIFKTQKAKLCKVDTLFKELINALWVMAIGALGALARVIHTKPSKVTLLMIITEIIMGGFSSYMAYNASIVFLGVVHSKAIIIAGIAAVMSREMLGLVVRVSTKEIKDKNQVLNRYIGK
jgi:hypothetical protein